MDDYDWQPLIVDPYQGLHSLLTAYKATRNARIRGLLEQAIVKEIDIVGFGQAVLMAELRKKQTKSSVMRIK